MEIKKTKIDTPFFSICIPQYNRTSFLIEACKVLAQQTFRNFEVCIADDRSTDTREDELIDYLKKSGFSFIYRKNRSNLRYDGNLRASIALAKGRYCFLHGNDDCLASPTTLEELYLELKKYKSVGVVITNYEDWDTGKKNWRVQKSRLVGTGSDIASRHFRNLSFVSGVLVDRVKAQGYATDKWDGSEMYQMFIAVGIVASGDYLLELDISTVRKGIQIPGEGVDSYATKPRLKGWKIIERKLPLTILGRLVADAVLPYLKRANRHKILERIIVQLYLFPYFLWIIEYRRVQSWPYALGVCLGMRPKNVFLGLGIGLFGTVRLYWLYSVVSVVGLTMPIALFKLCQSKLYYIAKSAFTGK